MCQHLPTVLIFTEMYQNWEPLIQPGITENLCHQVLDLKFLISFKRVTFRMLTYKYYLQVLLTRMNSATFFHLTSPTTRSENYKWCAWWLPFGRISLKQGTQPGYLAVYRFNSTSCNGCIVSVHLALNQWFGPKSHILLARTCEFQTHQKFTKIFTTNLQLHQTRAFWKVRPERSSLLQNLRSRTTLSWYWYICIIYNTFIY